MEDDDNDKRLTDTEERPSQRLRGKRQKERTCYWEIALGPRSLKQYARRGKAHLSVRNQYGYVNERKITNQRYVWKEKKKNNTRERKRKKYKIKNTFVRYKTTEEINPKSRKRLRSWNDTLTHGLCMTYH